MALRVFHPGLVQGCGTSHLALKVSQPHPPLSSAHQTASTQCGPCLRQCLKKQAPATIPRTLHRLVSNCLQAARRRPSPAGAATQNSPKPGAVPPYLCARCRQRGRAHSPMRERAVQTAARPTPAASPKQRPRSNSIFSVQHITIPNTTSRTRLGQHKHVPVSAAHRASDRLRDQAAAEVHYLHVATRGPASVAVGLTVRAADRPVGVAAATAR